MKTLLILHAGDDPHLVPSLLERAGATGWTALAPASGAGASGRREGTRAWPGATSVFLTVEPDALASTIARAVADARATLPPGDRLHVALLPTDDFL